MVDPARDAIGLLVRVAFHLLVDLVLHRRGVLDVVEALGPVLRGRLDVEIAEAEHALEDPLVEEDRVDAFERDLDAVLGDDAAAEYDSVGGEHEVGAHPCDVALHEPAQGEEQAGAERHLEEVGPIADLRGECGDEHDGEDRGRLGEEPPVRVQIEHEFL